MKIKDIRVAVKNPRIMGKEAKKALSKSISEFDDISGITVNQRTGNIVSGNHRWEELNNKYSGVLSLSHLKGEYHCLNSGSKFTGFVVRVVDWDEAKELAANVTANSSLVQGEFTSDLQDVLDEIAGGLDLPLFEDLRLDELQIDIDGLDDLDWDPTNVEESSRQRNENLEEAGSSEPAPGEVKEIITTIKISMPAEIKDTVRKDLKEMLAKKDYSKDINIV